MPDIEATIGNGEQVVLQVQGPELLEPLIAGAIAEINGKIEEVDEALVQIEADREFIESFSDGIASMGYAPQKFGKTSALPSNGNGNFGAALTFYRTPIATKGVIRAVTLTSGSATGNLTIVVGALSGTTITPARNVVINVPIALGVAQRFELPTPLLLNAGEYIGVLNELDHLRSTTGSVEESGGRWQALGTPSSVSTTSPAITTTRLEIQFDIMQVDFEAAAERINDIEASADEAGETADLALAKVDDIIANGPVVESAYGKTSAEPIAGTADYGAATTYYATPLSGEGTITKLRASGGSLGGAVRVVLARLTGNTLIEYARSAALTFAASTVNQEVALASGLPYVAGDYVGVVTDNGAIVRRTTAEESGGRFQATGDVTSVSTTAAPGLITTTRIEVQVVVEKVDFGGAQYSPPALIKVLGLESAPFAFVFDGASEAEGNHGETSVPAMMDGYFDESFPNFGVGGQTIVQMQTDAATQIDPLIAAAIAAGRMAILWVSSGGMYNWINTGSTRTGPLAVDELAIYCAARRAANPGIIIVLENMWAAHGTSFYDDADYIALNNAIATRAVAEGMVDVVMDLRTLPAETQDYTNLTYYNADGVHRTTLFNKLIAESLYLPTLADLLWSRMLADGLSADQEEQLESALQSVTAALPTSSALNLWADPFYKLLQAAYPAPIGLMTRKGLRRFSGVVPAWIASAYGGYSVSMPGNADVYHWFSEGDVKVGDKVTAVVSVTIPTGTTWTIAPTIQDAAMTSNIVVGAAVAVVGNDAEQIIPITPVTNATNGATLRLRFTRTVGAGACVTNAVNLFQGDKARPILKDDLRGRVSANEEALALTSGAVAPMKASLSAWAAKTAVEAADGSYISSGGVVTVGANTRYAMFTVAETDALRVSATIAGGTGYWLATYYNAAGAYIGHQQQGPGGADIVFTNFALTLPSGTAKVGINGRPTAPIVLQRYEIASDIASRVATLEGAAPSVITGFTGMKWASLGDSVTAMQRWQVQLTAYLGLGAHTNCGIGGTTVSKPDVGSPSMCDDARINAIPSDSELILFMALTNDWGQSRPLGALADIDATTFDNTTVYGALEEVATKLLARFNAGQMIGWITPIFGKNQARVTSGLWTSAYYNRTPSAADVAAGRVYGNPGFIGLNIIDYAKAKVDVARKYGFPVIDLPARLGWNKQNAALYYDSENGDNTYIHPNAALGGPQMAAVIADELMRLNRKAALT